MGMVTQKVKSVCFVVCVAGLCGLAALAWTHSLVSTLVLVSAETSSGPIREWLLHSMLKAGSDPLSLNVYLSMDKVSGWVKPEDDLFQHEAYPPVPVTYFDPSEWGPLAPVLNDAKTHVLRARIMVAVLATVAAGVGVLAGMVALALSPAHRAARAALCAALGLGAATLVATEIWAATWQVSEQGDVSGPLQYFAWPTFWGLVLPVCCAMTGKFALLPHYIPQSQHDVQSQQSRHYAPLDEFEAVDDDAALAV